MGRQNIFGTLSVTQVMPPSMRQDLVEFLIANRGHILPSAKAQEAFKSRWQGRTPIAEIYNRITLSGKEQGYSLLRLPSKSAALHEVVDMTFVPFDLLQLQDEALTPSKALPLIPELNNKLVVNITDLTRANGEFNDVTQFQGRVVRDFLSRSFFQAPGNVWISPTLVRYVAKVYSMTMGWRLANQFGLSTDMRSFLQTIFALFFVGQMTSTAVAQDFVRAHAKDLNLYNPQDLVQIFHFTQEHLHKPAPETLDDVITLINAYGHSQLTTEKGSRISRGTLGMTFASLHPEGRISVIALEYPPYFLYLILLVLSGFRAGLSFHMKTLNLLPEGKTVGEQLVKSPLLLAGL